MTVRCADEDGMGIDLGPSREALTNPLSGGRVHPGTVGRQDGPGTLPLRATTHLTNRSSCTRCARLCPAARFDHPAMLSPSGGVITLSAVPASRLLCVMCSCVLCQRGLRAATKVWSWRSATRQSRHGVTARAVAERQHHIRSPRPWQTSRRKQLSDALTIWTRDLHFKGRWRPDILACLGLCCLALSLPHKSRWAMSPRL